jgi:hypothetical protein
MGPLWGWWQSLDRLRDFVCSLCRSSISRWVGARELPTDPGTDHNRFDPAAELLACAALLRFSALLAWQCDADVGDLTQFASAAANSNSV